MKKVIKWLKESNRYKHLIGGVLIGGVAIDFGVRMIIKLM
jgi:hypothetical protein|nr:MAG TPA: hypothetical protein [Caudoviricetes sp.]